MAKSLLDTRPDREIEGSWKSMQLATLAGGLNRQVPDHLLAETETSKAFNVCFRQNRVRVDTGYVEFGTVNTTLRGVPKGGFTHKDEAGAETIILVTDDTTYRYVAAQDAWYYLNDEDSVASPPAINTSEAAGQTILTITDNAGFANGDFVGITLDDGTEHQAQIDAVVTPGAPGDIQIDVGLASISTGGQVVKAYDLLGSDLYQVVFAVSPAQAWTIFTNGVDTPLRTDGVSVAALAGFPADTCRTMSNLLRNGVLMCGNLVEGGSEKPYKVVWSDAGNPDEWVNGIAGFENLYDSRDSIVAIIQFVLDAAIYRRSGSISRVSFTQIPGRPFAFATDIHGEDIGGEGVGPVSPNAVFNLEAGHLVFDSDGIYLYSGASSITLISNKVFDEVFGPAGDLDRKRLDRSFVGYLDQNDEVFFFYPGTGKDWPDRALVWERDANRWRKRLFENDDITFAAVIKRGAGGEPRIIDLVGTIAEQTWIIGGSTVTSEAVKFFFLGTLDGSTMQYDLVAGDEDGTAINWQIRTKAFRGPDRFVRVNEINVEYLGDAILSRIDVDGNKQTIFTLPSQLNLKRRVVPIEFVDEVIQLQFDGSASGSEVGIVTIIWREESRWTL